MKKLNSKFQKCTLFHFRVRNFSHTCVTPFHSLKSRGMGKKMHYFTYSTTGGHRTAQSWQRVKKSPLARDKNTWEHWKCSERYKIVLRTPCATNSKCLMLRQLLLSIIDATSMESRSDQGNSLESPATRRGKELGNSPKAVREKWNLRGLKWQLQALALWEEEQLHQPQC